MPARKITKITCVRNVFLINYLTYTQYIYSYLNSSKHRKWLSSIQPNKNYTSVWRYNYDIASKCTMIQGDQNQTHKPADIIECISEKWTFNCLVFHIFVAQGLYLKDTITKNNSVFKLQQQLLFIFRIDCTGEWT